MSNEYFGLSIDPGMSSGLCLFSWGDGHGFRRLWVKQIGGGAEGLAAHIEGLRLRARHEVQEHKGYAMMAGIRITALVVERFTPRQNEGFSLTRDSVEPLRCEGVLLGQRFGPLIEWAEPSQQYFIGNSALPKAQKRKLAVEFLETHGLELTGADVGQKDANDATSATLHAIAYLRRIRHRPTLVQMFGPDRDVWPDA